jgi:hypothetical protein
VAEGARAGIEAIAFDVPSCAHLAILAEVGLFIGTLGPEIFVPRFSTCHLEFLELFCILHNVAGFLIFLPAFVSPDLAAVVFGSDENVWIAIYFVESCRLDCAKLAVEDVVDD